MLRANRLDQGLLGTVHWPLPQRSGSAELVAVCVAMHASLGHVRTVTDCAMVLHDVDAGRGWCLAWHRPFREVWQRFWHLADELGDVRQDRIAEWQRLGNHMADKKARRLAGKIAAWIGRAAQLGEAALLAADGAG
ncbi:unnamed protein product, partial [Prorocentrum cordatum]